MNTKRVPFLLAFFIALFLLFLWQLVDLQLVQGAAYRAQSVRKITSFETVEAARGALLDRNGTPLVSNRVSYQLSLSLSRMGDARNDTLLQLDALLRREGLSFRDSLPISRELPFVFTHDTLSDAAKTRYTRFLAAEKLEEPSSAPALLELLSTHFSLPTAISPAAQRSLCGLLYEEGLRRREISTLPYIPVENLEQALVLQLRELGLSGLTLSPTATREYHTTAAAHSLGRLGRMSEEEWTQYAPLGYSMDALLGKDGAEAAFESYLHGTPGQISREYDREGRLLAETYTKAPIPGQNLRLSLDLPLQESVDRILAERIPNLESAEGAAVAVLDVRNGGVLALSSYPSFSPVDFSRDFESLQADPKRPLLNRSLQGLYAPGSTYKMLTAVAGLEEGIITPKTKVLDTGRYTYYRNPQPRCWLYRQTGRTHGVETLSEALRDSCNIFFYDLGRRLGIERLEHYARSFGLGELTGIELRGEAKGVVASPAYTQSLGQTWYEGNTLSAAIGQENNLFTPLQLASYVATLANGGTRYRVQLLQSIAAFDAQGAETQVAPEILSQIPLSPDTLAAVKEGMLSLTQEGSIAAAFRALPFKVGAKTGSAQVAGNEVSNAVFVCFAPYENPEIAVAIVVEKGGSGSDLGRMAAAILDAYF